MPEDQTKDPTNPALDEFVQNVAKLNDGLTDVMASALRLQALILEDARNMMAEFGAIGEAAERDGDNTSDT